MQLFINAVLISLSIANVIGLLYVSRADKELVKAVSNFDVRLKTVEKILIDKDIVSFNEVEETIEFIKADRDAYVERQGKDSE